MPVSTWRAVARGRVRCQDPAGGRTRRSVLAQQVRYTAWAGGEGDGLKITEPSHAQNSTSRFGPLALRRTWMWISSGTGRTFE
eukprot:scaffold259919_cov31-Tisochrysis_lutea.AAC.8